MSKSDDSNAITFESIKEQVEKRSRQIIEEKLQNKSYSTAESQNWSNNICDTILKDLIDLNKNFKFIVNCLIMQKTECGLSISGSCYWDNDIDGNLTIKWENANLISIVNVFGCGL